jgi:hypothetical protein
MYAGNYPTADTSHVSCQSHEGMGTGGVTQDAMGMSTLRIKWVCR